MREELWTALTEQVPPGLDADFENKTITLSKDCSEEAKPQAEQWLQGSAGMLDFMCRLRLDDAVAAQHVREQRVLWNLVRAGAPCLSGTTSCAARGRRTTWAPWRQPCLRRRSGY